MKQDCANYDNCRLPVELCNADCARYVVNNTWHETLLDIANREYYETHKEAKNDRP